MKILYIFIATSFIQSPVFSEEISKDECFKHTVGIHTIKINERNLILAVSKVEQINNSEDSYALALDTARLNAKAKLANNKKNSNLQGVREIFNCKSGNFIHVGLVEKDVEAANQLLQKINESIKSIPSPK